MNETKTSLEKVEANELIVRLVLRVRALEREYLAVRGEGLRSKLIELRQQLDEHLDEFLERDGGEPL